MMAVLLAAAGVAWAYEVDGWAPYRLPLADTTEVANAALEARFERALDRVRCGLSDVDAEKQLARRIYRETARRMRVRDRPLPRSLGHGRYSGWLETSPEVDRIETGTHGVFDEVGPLDSPVLHFAGAASVVRLGGVPVGTDKVDHFLATGFDYARWSHWGRDPERAIRRGTRTERMLYGRLTSKAFSYADLEANWAGYRFYVGLLDPGSPFERDDEGCVQLVGDWDWAEWVGPDWDELANPSVYGPRVRKAVQEALLPDREAVCAVWAQSEPDPDPHVRGRAPIQEGPFGLDGLCVGALPRKSASTGPPAPPPAEDPGRDVEPAP